MDSIRPKVEDSIKLESFRLCKQVNKCSHKESFGTAIVDSKCVARRLGSFEYCVMNTAYNNNSENTTCDKKWFQSIIKYLDCILFLTDVDHGLSNTLEIEYFQDTIEDILSAYSEGKTVSLVVIINKVDRMDDTETAFAAQECRYKARRILEDRGLPEDMVEFVEISASISRMYQTFISSYNLDGLDQKEINRLAETELGRQGKSLAKDPTKHEELCEALRQRISEEPDQWRIDSGLHTLWAAIHKLIEDTVSIILDCFPRRFTIKRTCRYSFEFSQIIWYLLISISMFSSEWWRGENTARAYVASSEANEE